MGIIAFIILGAIAGAIAKALLPGDDPGGFIITTHHRRSSVRSSAGFWPRRSSTPIRWTSSSTSARWLTAIVGSIVLLLIYRAVAGRGGRRATV